MTNLLGKKEELKMFSSENDFINHLKVVRDNSNWNTLQSGETSFEVENGILADVAPSILTCMGVKQPEVMTGKSLITLS